MISTLCRILSAQATCKGDPIIGLHLLTLAPFSNNTLTSAGSPLKTAKSSGLGLSGSGNGAGISTRAPCFSNKLTREIFPKIKIIKFRV